MFHKKPLVLKQVTVWYIIWSGSAINKKFKIKDKKFSNL